MFNKNNNETLTNNLPNDNFCVCEDYSIPEHESTTIDKIIKILLRGELKENGFIKWYNIK